MARLRDVNAVVTKIGIWQFILRIYRRMFKNNLLVWASALAYSWLFSLFPFLIFLLTLMPYLPLHAKEGTEHYLHSAVMQLPPKAGETVWSSLQHQPPRGLLSTGLIVMIWVSSSGMSMTMQAMDKCYGATESRPYYKQRGLAILLTIIEAALILTVLILLPIGTIVTQWCLAHVQQVAGLLGTPAPTESTGREFLSHHVAFVIFIWQILRFVVSLILMFSATALIYHFGPSLRRRFRWLTPGAAFTIAIWLILGELFRFYVNHFGKGYKMYGALGGVAVLLLFFYIDAVVLLIGAEINSEIDNGIAAEPVALTEKK